MKNYALNFKLNLKQNNLKRKEVMNVLNLSKRDFERKANTYGWTAFEIIKLRELGFNENLFKF